MANILANLH